VVIVKGDRPAGRFYCPYCCSVEKIWATEPNRVVCASCGGVIGWYKKKKKNWR